MIEEGGSKGREEGKREEVGEREVKGGKKREGEE